MRIYRLNGFVALIGLIIFLVVLFLIINFIIIAFPILIIMGILTYIFRKNLLKWIFKRRNRKNQARSGIDKGTIDADFKVKK